jgi:glycosyltransferase involved in cell wall biosynthesis
MVVPNGCDTAMFPIVYPDKESTLKILYGGRLVAQKDPFTFLKSLLILKNAALSFQAIITGNGPLLTSMQDFAKDNHLADYIEFTGWQSKEQMPALYAQSHLFVLPSLAEGMSVAVLEALCSGLYVITTPVSGNTEMITEGINGKFVSLKNPEALANAILDFDQERKQEYPVKKEVVEQFRKMNDWAVVAQNYDEILNKVYRNI